VKNCRDSVLFSCRSVKFNDFGRGVSSHIYRRGKCFDETLRTEIKHAFCAQYSFHNVDIKSKSPNLHIH
jgi:hypothetical protein